MITEHFPQTQKELKDLLRSMDCGSDGETFVNDVWIHRVSTQVFGLGLADESEPQHMTFESMFEYLWKRALID